VLAVLLLDNGHVVPLSRIIDDVWGESAGDGTRNLVQVYVSNLRRALEPVATILGADVIQTRRPGYLVELSAEVLDLAAFERLTAAARRSVQESHPRRAVAELTEALALWRGRALADLADEDGLAPATTRLDAARLTAQVDLLELEIDLGRHRDVLDRAGALLSANALDERLRGLVMVALYRSGRQADALACFQDGRRLLVDELGIEPGPQLRRIEDLILRQAPELAAPAAGASETALATILASSLAAPACLVVGDRRFPLKAAVTTIGRRADQTIVLTDDRASRSHAAVRRSANGYELVDAGSTNGTRHNGERVSGPVVLQPGDEIRIGTTVLQFVEA
jgi:DNA-binding SARP family transcriptional activator